jgi:AhpD family alkylhydroperoxidase
MKKRLNIGQIAPAAYKAMMDFSQYLQSTGLEPIHKELIKIRASQVNGCAFCINMHAKDARKLGETEQRIYALSAWRDTTFFDEKERAILALTEEVTLIQQHVSDETYDQAVNVLGESYTAAVIMAAVIINGWNRIAITTGMQPQKDN